MFEKFKLKKKIKSLKNEITAVELKRVRSQAALVEAILTHASPDDNDVDYFNKFTIEINRLSDQLKDAQHELDKLTGKKA
jgi:predicted  nucleic acid-binding Zn-ribbon protein